MGRFPSHFVSWMSSTPTHILWNRGMQHNLCKYWDCTEVLQDVWEDTQRHSCLKKCTCPSDGSSCALANSCDRYHFACKEGYQRFSDGSTRCAQIECKPGFLGVSSVCLSLSLLLSLLSLLKCCIDANTCEFFLWTISTFCQCLYLYFRRHWQIDQHFLCILAFWPETPYVSKEHLTRQVSDVDYTR